MATAPLGPFTWVGRDGGGSRRMAGGPEQTYIKEKASQTYKIGDLVYLDTTSSTVGTLATVVVCGTSPPFIYGQARQDATGVTSAQALVDPIHPDDIFSMNVKGSSTTITSQVLLSNEYELIKDSAGVWVLNPDLAAARRVRVVGFDSRDAMGDTYGRVLVRFLRMQAAGDTAVGTSILQG